MKEIMGVNEVLGLQFVVPVAAVLVCALLVFVFGFKRVPEPNFEYDSSDDRKKKGKTKKKEKAAPSNGHVVNVDPVKVSSKPQQSMEKKEPAQKTKSKKQTKDVTVQQTTVQSMKSQEAPSGDVEGWTTAVSRKDKKKRKLGMEESVVGVEDSVVAVVTEEPVEQQVSVAQETQSPPMEQRGSKKSRQKSAKSAAQKDVPDNREVQAAEVTNKQEEIVQDVVKEPEEKMTEPATVDHAVTPVAAAAEEKPQTPSKKKKNKKKKEATAEVPTPVTAAVAEVVEVKAGTQTSKGAAGETAPVVDNTIEKQLAEAMQEHSEATGDHTTKQKISPKRPSKKKSKDGSVKANNASQPEASHSPVATEKEKSSIPSQEVQATASQAKPVSSPTEASSTSTGEPQTVGPVSFDEIGEWQEAKPVKKRKKPRRDN